MTRITDFSDRRALARSWQERRVEETIMAQERSVELHSEACRCHGYLWQVWVPGTKRAPCCRPGEDLPQGAILVPVSRWVRLGSPRTVEQYRSAELSQSAAQDATHSAVA